jgi:hypothetical protein
VPIFKLMTRLSHLLRRGGSHKADVGVHGHGNGHQDHRPSEEERRQLAEQARRFERALRELAKS